MAQAGPALNRKSDSLTSESIRLFLMTNTFETGGSERQLAVLAKNLDREKFQLLVGCIRRDGPFSKDFEEAPEFRLGGSLYGWQSLRARFRLAKYLRRNRIQIAHAFDFYTSLTLIPAARLARVAVVIGSFRQLGDLLTPAQFRSQAAVFRWCDAIVCNSQAGADRLAEDGLSRNKLFVIGNALQDDAFVAAPATLAPRPGVLRVGMVARMNARYKNHSGFLQIAARVHARFPDVEFVLAGDGPLRGEIEAEASSLGIGQHVVFLGDRRDVAAVFASMDVSVLTSDSEGLSNVIIEAMAAGVPVVAYDVGGNRELVNSERGAIVPAGKVDDFAVAVCRLLDQPGLRESVARNARTFAEDKFSLRRIQAAYEELYESLLRRRSSGNTAG